MNVEVYDNLKNTYMAKMSPLNDWDKFSYKEYTENDFQKLKYFINENTITTYVNIWKCICSVLYRDGIDKDINFKIKIYPIEEFYPYIKFYEELTKAIEEYKRLLNPNLKTNFLRNYSADLYDEDLLFTMLRLDGITYEVGTYENSNNKYLQIKITKEKIEEHINKANELGKWITRDEEDEVKRKVLLRSLQI